MEDEEEEEEEKVGQGGGEVGERAGRLRRKMRRRRGIRETLVSASKVYIVARLDKISLVVY